MSKDIKPGDLVMVVRGASCCGFMGSLQYGSTYITESVNPLWQTCPSVFCNACGHNFNGDELLADLGEKAAFVSMLKKLDPPAEGDSLPTRADVEQGVTA